MRIKSQWFREDAQKSATEIGGASAFIVWRVAQNALKNMSEGLSRRWKRA